jgi:hypothetical protein
MEGSHRERRGGWPGVLDEDQRAALDALVENLGSRQSRASEGVEATADADADR